jgi:hypothetical protein
MPVEMGDEASRSSSPNSAGIRGVKPGPIRTPRGSESSTAPGSAAISGRLRRLGARPHSSCCGGPSTSSVSSRTDWLAIFSKSIRIWLHRTVVQGRVKTKPHAWSSRWRLTWLSDGNNEVDARCRPAEHPHEGREALLGIFAAPGRRLWWVEISFPWSRKGIGAFGVLAEKGFPPNPLPPQSRF